MVTGTAGLLGVVGLGALPAATGAQESGDGIREIDDDTILRGQLADLDMNMAFENRMRLPGDPADEDREGVLHTTSDGESTIDYVTSVVDLRDRRLPIEDVEELEHDYYIGADDENASPDEAWLIIDVIPEDAPGRADEAPGRPDEAPGRPDEPGRPAEPPGRADEAPGRPDEKRVCYLFVKTLDDEVEEETWLTRDIAAEMRGETPEDDSRRWRAIEIAPEDIDDGSAIIETGRALQETDFFDNVFEYLEDQIDETDMELSDAELVVAGIGSGDTRTPSEIDIYYDDLVIEDVTYNFPATVPMEIELKPETVDDETTLTATLSFLDDEEGLELDDVDEDSVRLLPFDTVAPIVDVHGIGATDVDVDDETLVAEFDGEDVGSLFDEDGSQTVIVLGDFDVDSVAEPTVDDDSDAETAYETPYSFVATAEIELE